MDNERLIAAICRPLVWTKHPSSDAWRCDTMIGTYKVFAVTQPVTWDFDGLDNEGISVHTSAVSSAVPAAQAAAEADYRACIAAALDLDKIGRLVEAADRHLTTLTAYFKGMGGANGGKLAADSLEAERDFRAALAELEGAK